ncbi:MAG TPA: alpha/beta fold hydrolase [Polyangiaceae bacterium]|nr:alpha/beta fold hydrolase [Polyangiaceae bacterium]
MSRRTYATFLLLPLLALGCGGDGDEASPGAEPIAGAREACTKADALAGFESRFADVDGERVHYMIGGEGPPLVLLHGWPAAWVSWKNLMPALAARFTVVAPDLRGLGDSSVPDDFQLDAPSAAENVFGLTRQLGYPSISLAGHDWGGAVAYSYALAHRDQVAKLALLEGGPSQDFAATQRALPQTFWFNWFQRVEGLPEELVAGRERLYLTWFYQNFSGRPGAIGPEDIDHYVCTYSRPGSMRAGFEYYRDQEIGAESQEALLASGGRLAMPVLAVSGQYSLGPDWAKSLDRVAERVTPAVVADAAHWVVEERPDFVLAELERFLSAP